MSELYSDFIDHCGKLLNAGRHDECQMLLDGYLANNADDPLALYLMSSSLLSQNRTGLAITLLERSVEKDATLDFAWHNLGIAYKTVERTDDARKCYEKTLELTPDRADTMAMMSGVYVNEGNPGPGIEWAKKSLAIEPDNPHAWNHLAHCLLEQGNYAEGWEAYSHRWDVPQRAKDKRDYGDVPKWDGKPTKRLVIHGEQGLGDEILFLTCLPEGLADELVIECAPRLVRLIQRSFGCEVYGTHAEVMEHDKPTAWLAMGDLPGMFPTRGAFLKADPERVAYWRSRLEAEGPGPYIAVAWEGGLRNTHRSHRNAPRDMWLPLLKNGTPVSVQYTKNAPRVAEAFGIPHWQEAIDDLDEMAALIEACDLVVSVCQTAVHLAGGLGKECICLTPKACAWRYVSETDRMKWYPSVRMIRQEDFGEWGSVFTRADKDIADFVRLRGAEPQAA